jgi:alkylation response protein AidB-like acyl-CoA dehydrogenase
MLAAGVDWRQYADAGWPGLEVAEELGGSGAGFAEVAVVLRELGRAAAKSPYVGTAALGVGALNLLDGDGPRQCLPGVASGAVRLAVALPANDSTDVAFRLERAGGGHVLNGAADFVADAGQADRILVVAADPESVPVIVAVEADHPGIRVEVQPVVDATREFATVAAVSVALESPALWRFRDDPEVGVRALLDRGALAAACDSLGVAEAMLEATVAYAGVRQQFGRFIGSFQAVKHACADMLVQITVGRELLDAAVDAVTAGAPDAWIAVSMAKSFVGGLGVDVAGKAMQLHGGFGYTWDSGVHVYLKRALLGRALFGSPAAHRARLASRYREAVLS